MKKLVLSVVLATGLGAAHTAQAQAAFLIGRLVGIGIGAAINASHTPKLTPEQRAAQLAETTPNQAAAESNAASLAGPTELVKYRTPADKLPKQAAAQITDLEAQLDQCHAAMLATPAGAVCTAEQRAAIRAAAVSVARAKPGFDLAPYQQEMAFYTAEDGRRQQTATPTLPAK